MAPSSIADFGFYSLRSRGGTAEGAACEVSGGIRRASRFGITTDDTPGSTHAEITKQLISIVNHNPELKAMLEKSIAQAKQVNPDRRTNPAQTLDEYYEYIDWAARAMPWAILPDAGELYPKLYEQIDQSVAYFYFVNDQPLEELEGRGLYNNSIQYLEPYRSWLIEFTAQWGN